MAEEATIQGVVSELQVINQLIHDTTDLHLEGLIAIESVATAIDTKVGRMLEQPAIQETLEKFSQDIVDGITGSFDAALEYQKQRDKEQDREEKGEVQGGQKKGFGEGVKDSFKAGLKSGPKMPKALGGLGNTIKDIAELSGELAAAGVLTREFLKGGGILKPLESLKGFFANLGSRIFIFLSGFQNFQFFESLKSLTKTLGKLAIPLTLIIGTIGGIIEAFNYFNEAGDGIQSKFMAALEGFVSGFLGTLLAPLDWIIHGIGDFFGIEWMQKLQIVEEVKYGVELFFNFLEDVGQVFGELYDSVAESAFGQALKDIWEKITGAFDSFLQTMVDAYNAIAKYVPGLPMIGEDTREKGKTSEDYKMDRKEQREGVKAARNSGLYDSNVFGESTIDREKVKEAPTNQLIAIVKDDDLSPEDEKFVLEEIASREKNKEKGLSKYEKSKAKVDADLASVGIDPGTEKRGKEIGGPNIVQKGTINGTEVLAGKPRVETEGRINGTEVLSGKSSTELQMVEVPTRELKSAPAATSVVNNTTNSSVLQEVSVPTRAKKTATIPSAMSRKPVKAEPKKSAGEKPNKYVTIDPVTGKYRAFAPNLAATGGAAYALFDTVKEANEYTQSVDPAYEKMMADELAAFDAEFGLTAPETDTAGRISGAQGAAAQSGELQARQSDLSNAQAANSAASSNVAVVDNSTQQSIVTNNTTSGVNPSPFDKSDRTHKRGSYRGT